jgi:hypothetical protein
MKPMGARGGGGIDDHVVDAAYWRLGAVNYWGPVCCARAKAEQLGVLIFIHPQGTTELSAYDACPGLKICAAHAGGYLPSYAARSDQGCMTFSQRCTNTAWIEVEPAGRPRRGN